MANKLEDAFTTIVDQKKLNKVLAKEKADKQRLSKAIEGL